MYSSTMNLPAETMNAAVGGLDNDLGEAIAINIGNRRQGEPGWALPFPKNLARAEIARDGD
jgi:hypothetical protein